MKFLLSEIRNQKRLTQEQLARKCDITTSAVRSYESGKKKQYSHDLIEKFCEVLECEPGDLFVIESQAARDTSYPVLH